MCSPADLQVSDWPCVFSLLTEAGGKRTEAAEGMDSMGETVEKPEGAGEQGKPHCVWLAWFEILYTLLSPAPAAV